MKIGLIDVDGHNYPNIALMKISAYHKAQGDAVSWYQPLFSGHMDRVYMSKVFSFTPEYPYYIDADMIIKGGTGYAIQQDEKGREYYDHTKDMKLMLYDKNNLPQGHELRRLQRWVNNRFIFWSCDSFEKYISK